MPANTLMELRAGSAKAAMSTPAPPPFCLDTYSYGIMLIVMMLMMRVAAAAAAPMTTKRTCTLVANAAAVVALRLRSHLSSFSIVLL